MHRTKAAKSRFASSRVASQSASLSSLSSAESGTAAQNSTTGWSRRVVRSSTVGAAVSMRHCC